MALQDLNPVANGDHAGWTLVAGSSKWAAVAKPDDDATSYIEIAREGTDKYSATVGTKPPGLSAVNGLKVGLRGNSRDNASGTQIVNPFARLGGSDGTAQAYSGLASAPAFSTVGLSAVDRPGGGSWTVADIDSSTLQVGVFVETWEVTDPGFVGATTLWLEVDFAPPIGMLVFGIIASLGPLCAVPLEQLGAIAREVCRRTPYRLRIQPHEYLQAWRELREHRYRRFWFRPAAAR